MNTALLMLVLEAFAPAVRPEAVTEPDADPTATHAEIAALVQAGRLDEASARLAAASLPAAARHRLVGLVALRRGDHQAAALAFAAALKDRPDDAALRLHLASAELGRGDPAAALLALEGTETLGLRVVAQPLLLARARQGTGDLDGAYATLVSATRRFPTELGPRIELMALCAGQDLRAAARAWADEVVALAGDRLDRDTAAAIFAATWRDREALGLLETLASRFGDDVELRAHLAYAWAGQGSWYTAATLFERAGPGYAFEAADQYRLAGLSARALAHNARVADAARRIEQRIEILFAGGQMARVVALQAEAERVGAWRPSTRLRLAHAQWRLGQHARAAALARGLVDGDQADGARALLRAMGLRATGQQAPADADEGG